MKKKILAVLLVVTLAVMLVQSTALATGFIKGAEVDQELPVLAKRSMDDLKKSEQLHIEKAVEVSKTDGESAAEIVNEYIDRKENFEIALREVMNFFYSDENCDKENLEEFCENVDDSAEEIIDHYEEAAMERGSADQLEYQCEKVLISFPYGTSMEEIETVVNNEGKGFEVIDDGEVRIPDELPDYKKKRLEAIKDYKSDILILADISLEDTVERAEDKFEAYGCVESTSKNVYFEGDGTVSSSIGSVSTNDPAFNNTDQWYMNSINVQQAWQRIENRSFMHCTWIAVIDCGVQMSHPDLKDVLHRSYSVDVTRSNMKLIDCDDSRQYENGKGQYTSPHGTMVAGIIAAEANNGLMGAGIASAGSTWVENPFKILAIKADKSYGEDRHITKAYLAKAINYAVSHGAEVINISYSALPSAYDTESVKEKRDVFAEVRVAVEKAIAADVTLVCSAGNDGSNKLRYPAAFNGVIGVGATRSNNKLTGYTNESNAVDIVAPGGEDDDKKIYSTAPTTTTSGYKRGTGTSYATPQVAAAVAMMHGISKNWLTPAQILTKLKNTSTVNVKGIGNQGKTFKFLNAGAAVAGTN